MIPDQARAPALDLLLGDPQRADTAVRSFEEQLGWMAAVEICSAWGVLPQLRQRCDTFGIAFDDTVRHKFHKWANAVFLWSAACLHQGARALSALASEGIDAVAIKGAAAIANLYGGARDRTIGDTDVLLRAADVERAIAVLHQMGFQFTVDGDLPRQLRFAQKDGHGTRTAVLAAPDDSKLDLHWRLGRLNTDQIVAAAHVAHVYGHHIRVSDAEHGFLLGVHHALRNGFVPDRVVRDLLDCQIFLERIASEAAIARVGHIATRWRLAAPALAMVQILARFRPGVATAERTAAFARGLSGAERRRADALTRLFLINCSALPWNDDLHYLLDPRFGLHTARRILVGRSAYPWLMRTTAAQDRGALPLNSRIRRLGRSLRSNWRLLLALKSAQLRAS